jgi:predicted membrane protein
MTTRNFRVSFQFIIGLLILGLGVLYMLQSFGVLYARDITTYWPALIVIYGVSRIIQGDTAPQKVWGAFWAFVGTIWVLDKMDIIYFDFIDLWPLILVALGVSLIWGTSHRLRVAPGGGPVGDSGSAVNAFAFLGGFKRANDSQDFRGGEVTAIMGSCEIDLRKASIREGEAVLTLVAIMGGIELWIPEDWAVTLQGVPILGGYEDETHRPSADTRKRLIIKGYSIMGGVEVKN